MVINFKARNEIVAVQINVKDVSINEGMPISPAKFSTLTRHFLRKNPYKKSTKNLKDSPKYKD